MTRALLVVPAEPTVVLEALRLALAGDGPAVLPGTPTVPVPSTVDTRISLVVETSGSTARPKRVALSTDALLASATASESALGGMGQWLLALPTHYIAGINVLVRSIVAETEPVVLEPGPFDPVEFAESAARLTGELRFTSLVPAQLGVLLDDGLGISALRTFDRVLVGGQSTPQLMLAKAKDLGIKLTRTYGSSETAGGCVYDGIPIGSTRLRAVNGEVHIAGSVLAEGYLDEPERTATAFTHDGAERWYRTGDLGEIVDGVLRVSGRIDDVIISGGVKVSLGDIEREIRALPGQRDAVVVRTASERWGEQPVLVTTTQISLSELRDRLAALGPAAVPARVIVVTEIPMLGTGKPDRLTIASLAK
jgi:O-succinylbenzoic acid--CoA ligase